MGMTVAETFRSWTAMKVVIGTLGIVILLLCQAIFFRA
jgi:H+/gluconate symporter-like permease